MKPIEKLKKLIPPCPKCPYKLGQIKFIQNPCRECRMNDYQTYRALIETG
jgi:hypothetical protein